MDIFELVKSAPPVDPLSETTRAERRSLLAVNLVAIALTAGGLIPSNVLALGISLTAGEQRGLLVLLLLVVLYYVAAFLIYGLPEWRRARADDQLFQQRLADFIKPSIDQPHSDQIDFAELEAELEEVFAVAQHAKLASYYGSSRSVRIVFDFFVPIGISIWSISFLVGGILERPITSTVGWSNPAIWAVLGTAVVGLFVWGGLAWRQWWEGQALSRAPQYLKEDLSHEIQRMIRKALEFPEGSAEREKAKKHIEKEVRNFIASRRAT